MILGKCLQAHTLESYRVGSVAWSMRYFPDGQFSARAFQVVEFAKRSVGPAV